MCSLTPVAVHSGRRGAGVMGKRRGFSLVEMLVVVAIVAVLAAVLFPVLASARGKARHSTCIANLRQLGAALIIYTRDHFDTYPYDLRPRAPARPGAKPAYDGTNKWDASPIIAHMRPYIKSDRLAFCPDRPDEVSDLGPLSNYEFNGLIALNDSPQAPHHRPVRVYDVADPSHVLVFEDYSDSPHYHAGFRNFAMCDGRAVACSSRLQGAPPAHAKWWKEPEP